MLESLLFLAIVAPFIAAGICFAVPSAAVRKMVVLATGALLTVVSILLFSKGSFSFEPASAANVLVALLDFGLLLVMLYLGFVTRSGLVKLLVGAQLVIMAVFELFVVDHAHKTVAIFADSLSLLMVLIISIVGSLICIFALPYMDHHEEHLHLQRSKQPQFFLFLVLFLGAMNGLVLSNDLTWLYFFFEITTLCSFMLIGHDGTDEAKANALRALVLNSVGGLAFVLGIWVFYKATGTLDIQAVLAKGPGAGMVLLSLALLCLAGITKAAQLPFQSWLLGAMVAPTPVSALLHSSTMVKAGVYIVMRLAPAYAGTFLSDCLALVGAFTFLATAALAVGQSNGKRILAYSTIGNLGLIIACAGINTPESLTAGIMLILFHAVSKALLFLAVGTIEQGIGSRDIEVMRGLYKTMPRTTMLTIIGVSTMLLPPFGVLMAKWMAIEAASSFIVVVVLLALGSALSVVFWGRWAGILMSTPFTGTSRAEAISELMLKPMQILASGAVALAFVTPWIFSRFIKPLIHGGGIDVQYGVLSTPSGAFVIYPLFFALVLGVFFAYWAAKHARKMTVAQPYMCGANYGVEEGAFVGPLNQPVKVTASNYYLNQLFGEGMLTPWLNMGGLALLLLMIGGAL